MAGGALANFMGIFSILFCANRKAPSRGKATRKTLDLFGADDTA
jgi:hypothetical protein